MENKKNLDIGKLKEKLTAVKKETILVIFLTGALLLIIVWPSHSGTTGGGKTNTVKEEASDQSSEEEGLWDYKQRMEKELEEILKSMDGVGEVKVMISVGDSGKTVVEKDVSLSKHSEGEEDLTTLTDSERSEETVYEEGESGEEPFVVNTLSPQIQGVLVVASGGDDPEVKAKVLEAVMALFQLESHKISIVKGK